MQTLQEEGLIMFDDIIVLYIKWKLVHNHYVNQTVPHAEPIRETYERTRDAITTCRAMVSLRAGA